MSKFENIVAAIIENNEVADAELKNSNEKIETENVTVSAHGLAGYPSIKTTLEEAASAASSVVARYVEACERMSNIDAYVFDVTIRNDEGKKLASIEVTLEKIYK